MIGYIENKSVILSPGDMKESDQLREEVDIRHVFKLQYSPKL